MFDRETWPAEALRRALESVRTAPEGDRHSALIGAAARVADYVAAGALHRPVVEAELSAAAEAAGMSARKDGARDVKRCIQHGLGKGKAESAWYPAAGMNGEPMPRRFSWLGGRIIELKGTKMRTDAHSVADLPTVELLRSDFPVTHFPDRYTTHGDIDVWTWAQLAEAAADPMDWPEGGKDALPLWAFVEFEGHSRADRPDGLDDAGKERKRPPTIEGVYALVLDYDDDPAFSLDAVARWWGSVRYVAHTSGSHRVAKGKKAALPRGRVILALSRAVDEAEYNTLASWVVKSGRGRVGETELKNARRCYFVPARGPGGYERDANLIDQAIDVDEILRRAEMEAKTDEELADAKAPQEDVMERLHVRKDGSPLPSLRNVVAVLDGDARWTGRLTRCEFSRRDMLDGRAMRDDDDVEIACWLAEVYGLDVGAERVHQALLAVCGRHLAHPVREYLEGLAWDGESRLEAWLRYAGGEIEGLGAVFGAKWMISAVARVFEPGCQVDSVLILAGKQGLGKTSTFRVLGGAAWHSESSLPIGDRDAYQQLDGVWIYELGELDSLRRSEMSAVKAYLTAKIDKFRPSYGRNVVERPRQNVFAGTTNDEQFLPDAGRRWWVVRVEQVADLEWLARNRDQLWAEAVHRYRAGERWWLDAAQQEAQRATVDAFRHRDPWEEPVQAWLGGQHQITIAALLTDAIRRPVEQQTRGDEMRVAELLKSLGWSKRKDRRGNMVWRSP